MALQFIDVSNWKPDVDVTGARDGVVVQTTWGSGGFNGVNLANGVSTVADRQVQAALAAGKAVGVMHYYMGGDPNAEAGFFLSNNRGYLGRAVVCVDWESADNPRFRDPDTLRDLLKAFTATLNGGTGLLYCQQSEYHYAKPICDELDWGIWVAQYATMDPTGVQDHPWNEDAYDCAMRQYTDNLTGFGTPVDGDIFYGDRAQWEAYVAGSNRGFDGTTPPHAPAPAPAPAPAGSTYVVQPGDTLSGIAARYNVPMGAITGYASGDPDLIYPGETLTIGAAAAPAASGRTYTVQPGDTLSAIAQKVGWGSNYQGLAQLNHIADPDLIHPGDTINC